jgi:hypothetical protein
MWSESESPKDEAGGSGTKGLKGKPPPNEVTGDGKLGQESVLGGRMWEKNWRGVCDRCSDVVGCDARGRKQTLTNECEHGGSDVAKVL